jgi:hypothetical protein
MSPVLKRIDYSELSARQRENFNFQKLASKLAEYGFNCLRLSDDWQGADFLACHIDGETFLKVQLKGRFCCDKKYLGKSIHIAFFHGDDCYLYPHDEIMLFIDQADRINDSVSWSIHKSYSWPVPPKWILERILEYKI